MSRTLLATITLPLLAAALLACSTTPSGPHRAVTEFYDHLNSGDYSEAMALYDSETRETIEDPEVATADSFAKWAVKATRQGTLDKVDLIKEETVGESSQVEFELVFGSGARERHSVSLRLEGGAWKLGMIG